MGNKETNQDVIVVFQAEEEVAVQQVGQRKCPEAGQGPERKEPFQQYCQIGFILWSTSAGMQSTGPREQSQAITGFLLQCFHCTFIPVS